MQVTWESVVTVLGAAGSISTLIAAAFGYGKLTQKVTDLRDDVKEVKADVKSIQQNGCSKFRAVPGSCEGDE